MLAPASQSSSDEAPTTHMTEYAQRSRGRDLTKKFGKTASDLMLCPSDCSQGSIDEVGPDEDAESISCRKQVQRSSRRDITTGFGGSSSDLMLCSSASQTSID